MAITTTCPNCKARFRLAEELAGKKVRCQKCNGIFDVPVFDGSPGSPSSEESGEEQAAPEMAVTSAPPPRAVAVAKAFEDDDGDEDDSPRFKKKGRDRRPPSRRREPANSGSGSNMLLVILGIAGLAVLSCVICGGVGAAMWIVNAKPNPPAPIGIPNDGFVQKKLPPVIPQPPGPGNAINVNFGADGVFRDVNHLTNLDPVRLHAFGQKNHKLYAVRMEANRQYQIDLMSDQFDAYLILDNEAGQTQREDDDSGGNLNSRIIFSPNRTGLFRISATSLAPNNFGQYTLEVRRLN